MTSDFVTNSYGESWDLSCEKSWVPFQNQWVPVKKNKSDIENAWAFMYQTKQLIWRQTPKLCIILYWN